MYVRNTLSKHSIKHQESFLQQRVSWISQHFVLIRSFVHIMEVRVARSDAVSDIFVKAL